MKRKEASMNARRQQKLEAFVSLRWYDTLVSFILRFLAKTSEILLGVGIIVSSANFLTDGKVLNNNPLASNDWAWIQALAIDSSLGISFYAILLCVKQRDWIKCLLYSILTLLLALVAGSVTNIDIFSHAMHLSMSQAMTQLGLDVKLLSTLRSIAVVGFLLMSRMKEVSFKTFTQQDNDTNEQEHTSHPEYNSPVSPISQVPPTVPTARFLTANDLALLVQTIMRLNQTVVVEEPGTARPASQSGSAHTLGSPGTIPNTPSASSPKPPPIQHPTPSYAGSETNAHTPLVEAVSAPGSEANTGQSGSTSESLQSLSAEREAQLQHAYQELQAEGSRISGRTLAERAHMARALCTQWLQQHEPQRARRRRQLATTKNHTQEPAS